MKKKIIALVLILCVTSTVMIFAGCQNESDKIFVIEDNILKRITEYGKTLSDIVIPDGVTNIGKGVFHYNLNLKSVKLPESVKIIDRMAFSDCLYMTNINIPDGVEYIGDKAFANCYNLTSVDLPTQLKSVGTLPFLNCYSLVLKFAGNEPFENIDEIIQIGKDFRGKQIGNIPIVYDKDNNEESYDGYIYYLADNGIQYALKDGKAKVSGHSFLSEDFVEIESDVVYNGETYQVVEIEDYGMYWCGIRRSLSIPNGVTRIGNMAFCYSFFESIEIPASVMYIGEYAFIGCNKLTMIYCEAQSKPSGWSVIWNKKAIETEKNYFETTWGYDMGSNS